MQAKQNKRKPWITHPNQLNSSQIMAKGLPKEKLIPWDRNGLCIL